MIEIFLKKLKSNGIKQREIAKAIDMSEQYICDLKRGKSLSVETLIKLADAYGVTTDEILGRTIKKHDDM